MASGREILENMRRAETGRTFLEQEETRTPRPPGGVLDPVGQVRDFILHDAPELVSRVTDPDHEPQRTRVGDDIRRAARGPFRLLAPPPDQDTVGDAYPQIEDRGAQGIEQFIPSGVLDAYSLLDIGREALTPIDTPLPGAERAHELTTLRDLQAGDLFDVEYESNIRDVLLDIGPTAFIPGRFMPQMNTATETAVNVVLPLNQGTTMGRYIGGGALSTGLSSGILEIINQQIDNPNWTPVQDYFFRQGVGLEDPEYSPDVIENEDGTTSLDEDDLTEDSPVDRRDKNEISPWILLGGVAARRGLGKTFTEASQMGAATTRQFDPETTMSRSETIQSMYDQSEALSSWFGRQGRSNQVSEHVIEETDNILSSVRDGAASQMEMVTYREGILPDHYNLSIAPQRFRQRMDAMPEPDRQAASDLINLRDELDNRALYVSRDPNKRQPSRSMDQEIRFEGTDAGIRQRIQQLEQNSHIRQFADDYRQVTRELLDYMRRRGRLTKQEYTNFRDAHPNFRPDYTQRQEAGIVDRFIGRGAPIDVQTGQRNVIYDRDVGPGMDPNLMRPDEALREYARNVVRQTETNWALRQATRNMGLNPVRRVKSDQQDNYLRVYTTAGPRYYRMDDPALRHIAENSPRTLNAMLAGLHATRTLYQTGTTGFGQPGFAPVSLGYDLMLGQMTAGRGIRSGYLPARLGDVGIPDPTAFIAAFEGFARGSAALGTRYARDFAYRIVDRHPVLAENISAERFARVLDRQFKRSYLAIAESHRALNSRFAVDYLDVDRFRIANTPVGRTVGLFSEVLDIVNNAYRLGRFIRNHDPNAPIDHMLRVHRDTRRSSGDFTRAGVGVFADIAGATMPYYNVAVQALRRFGQTFHENPRLAMSATAMNVAVMTYPAIMAWRLGEEYVNHYWNNTSWTERLSRVYFYDENTPPENAPVLWFPLPEASMIGGTALGILDALYGFSSGNYQRFNQDEINGVADLILGPISDEFDAFSAMDRGWEGFRGGLARNMPLGVPPVLQAAAGAFGARISPERFALEGRPEGVITDINEQFIDEGRGPITNIVNSARAKAVAESIFGTIGGQMMEASQQYERVWTGTRDGQAAMKEFTNTLASRMAHASPGFAIAADSTRAIGGYPEITANFRNKWSTLDRIAERHRAINLHGAQMSRSQGMIEPTPRPSLPDQTEYPEAFAAGRELYNEMQRSGEVVEQINNIRSRIDAIRQSTTLSREMKTNQINDLLLERFELEKMAYGRILDFEEQIGMRIEDLI